MPDLIQRVTSICVLPKGEPTYSEKAFTIHIRDQSCGEYLEVEQAVDGKSICIDPDEWIPLRNAIEVMFHNLVNYAETKPNQNP